MLLEDNVDGFPVTQVTEYRATPTPGVFIFTVPNAQATLAYPDGSGGMFIHPAARSISEDPETFKFTASVVVGPFHQVVNQTRYYVAPGPMSTTVSTLVLSSQNGVVAGETFAGNALCTLDWAWS